MPQYFKLRKKVEAGARFVINQIGWNARKDDELLRWIRREELPRLGARERLSPLAGGGACLPRGKDPGSRRHRRVARARRAARRERRTRAGRSSSTWPPSTSRSRAVSASTASTSAATCRRPTFGEILDLAGSFAGDDWRAFAPRDPLPVRGRVLLLRARPGDEALVGRGECGVPRVEAPAEDRLARAAQVPLQPAPPHAAFEPDAPLFPAGRAFYRAVEKAAPARKVAHAAEQAAKVPLFGCRDCGDCSLPDIAYVCPESQCAKNQRNGPCGGTREGLCEVYDTECIWSQAYERLKAYGEEESMLDGPVDRQGQRARTGRARGRTPSSAATTTRGRSGQSLRA